MRNEAEGGPGVAELANTVSLGLFATEPCARITPFDFGRNDSREQRLIRRHSVLICR